MSSKKPTKKSKTGELSGLALAIEIGLIVLQVLPVVLDLLMANDETEE